MQWSRNVVYSHFTLCLRAPYYRKQLSQHPWYNLWTRIKGPHPITKSRLLAHVWSGPEETIAVQFYINLVLRVIPRSFCYPGTTSQFEMFTGDRIKDELVE